MTVWYHEEKNKIEGIEILATREHFIFINAHCNNKFYDHCDFTSLNRAGFNRWMTDRGWVRIGEL